MAELASSLRKILKTDSPKPSTETRRDHTIGKVEPLDGWAEGVTLNKAHYVVLLKPQIVLRGSELKDTTIITAAQAKLQAFAIMDDLHIDDPISGKIMSRCVTTTNTARSGLYSRRNYMSLFGLQAFYPTHPLVLGSSSIPLEVLVDLRCESPQFERMVPPTDAIFHYDKFNRLRLRNTLTTQAAQTCASETQSKDAHLRNQTVS